MYKCIDWGSVTYYRWLFLRFFNIIRTSLILLESVCQTLSSDSFFKQDFFFQVMLWGTSVWSDPEVSTAAVMRSGLFRILRTLLTLRNYVRRRIYPWSVKLQQSESFLYQHCVKVMCVAQFLLARYLLYDYKTCNTFMCIDYWIVKIFCLTDKHCH